MGKQSRSKRQGQKNQAQVNTNPGKPREVSHAMPASLMGGSVASASPRAAAKQSNLEIGSEHVRNDIKRILILLSVVAIILIGLTTTSIRSDVLDKAGNSLSGFLKLQ
jgi:hypothetical protein